MEKLKQVFDMYKDGVGYRQDAKLHFGNAARNFLGKLSKEFGFTEKEICWTRSGIAVSGEVTLKGMFGPSKGVHVDISLPSQHGIMFRSITGLKDHRGGRNEWFTIEKFNNHKEIAIHIRRTLGEDRAEGN